jgi:acetate kinase
MIRARVTARLAWLGVKLAPEANARGQTLISSPDSRVAIYVLPTDEELMIARHTVAIVGQTS